MLNGLYGPQQMEEQYEKGLTTGLAVGFLVGILFCITLSIVFDLDARPRLVGYGCEGTNGPIFANEEDEFPRPCKTIELY